MINQVSLGAVCALGTALSYIAMGITFGNIHFQFLKGFNPDFMASLLGIEIAVGAIFALGAIRPITSLAADAFPNLAAWAYNIAFAGYAISAMNGLSPMDPYAVKFFPIDPNNVLTHGGVGFWIFAVSIAARKKQIWPSHISILGFIAAVLLVLFSASSVALTIGIPNILGAILGLVGGCVVLPIWFILVACRMPVGPSDGSGVSAWKV